MKNYSDIWLIFLGSFLTFFATIIVELIKDRRAQSKRTQNFKLVIKQELATINKELDRLKTVLDYKYYYDYSLLEILTKDIEGLQSYKQDSIYLANEDIQEKFIDLASDLLNWVKNVKLLQDNYYDQERKLTEDLKNIKKKGYKKLSIYLNVEQLTTDFNRNSTNKSIDLVEIKRRLDEFIKIMESKMSVIKSFKLY